MKFLHLLQSKCLLKLRGQANYGLLGQENFTPVLLVGNFG